MIPYGRQDVSAADVAAVVAVLTSDFLTQGPAVPRFERAVAEACGAPHAVAANSATSALHVACLALGLGPGDALWTSPITFVASANCALYCGAAVDFVDIDGATLNLCPQALAAKLAAAERAGRLPKVVMPVHLGGQPCDMAAIGALARRYGFRVIEDASHAIGASDGDAPVGACRFSDITVFSFHPVKIVTAGEGGVATTRDPVLAEAMRRRVAHGITRDPAAMTGEVDGPWSYEQIELGFNYRMTDLQAALGASQVARLHDYVSRRHAIADRYDALLAGLPVRVPQRRGPGRSALHLYPIRLGAVARTRRAVFEFMRGRGIGVNVHYIPVPSQPYYRALGFRPEHYPEAARYYAEAISLPLYPTLRLEQQDAVVAALRDAVS